MQDLRNRFLEGMSRAATFVAVATTDGEAGRFGVTADWACVAGRVLVGHPVLAAQAGWAMPALASNRSLAATANDCHAAARSRRMVRR